MKISEVPIGTIIKCCGSKAEVLKHGELGTRVNVLQAKEVEFPGFVLGFQIWSSATDVEYASDSAGKGHNC